MHHNRRTSQLGCASVVLALALAAAGTADAHTRSQSFSTWQVSDDGTVRATYNVQAREVTRLVPVASPAADLGPMLAEHLASRLAVRGDGERCPRLGPARVLAASKGHTRVEMRFRCPPGSELAIEHDAFFEVAPSHVHFARVRLADAAPVEHLFTDARRTRTVRTADAEGGPARPESGGATFAAYVQLGVEHILIGVDHLAFLLALLLLSRSVRDVVLMVTGFTLGHSITLSLAALGWVQPDVGVIEALIGFTIAIVAAETVTVATGTSRAVAAIGGGSLGALALVSWATGAGPPPQVLAGLTVFTFSYLRLAHTRDLALRLAPVLTAVFGLVHGFGFASVLMEIGLPDGRLVPALLGFNVGVEIGQLGVVVLVWAAFITLRRATRGADLRLGADALAGGLCGLGIYWFVERAFGGG